MNLFANILVIVLWTLRFLTIFIFILAVRSAVDSYEQFVSGRRFNASITEVQLICTGIEQAMVSFVDDQSVQHAFWATIISQTQKVGDSVTVVCSAHKLSNCKLAEFFDMSVDTFVLIFFASICAAPELLTRFTRIGEESSRLPIHIRNPVVDVGTQK